MGYLPSAQLDRAMHLSNKSSYLVFENDYSLSSSSDANERRVSVHILHSNQPEEVGSPSSSKENSKLIQSQRINPGTPDMDMRRKINSATQLPNFRKTEPRKEHAEGRSGSFITMVSDEDAMGFPNFDVLHYPL